MLTEARIDFGQREAKTGTVLTHMQLDTARCRTPLLRSIGCIRRRHFAVLITVHNQTRKRLRFSARLVLRASGT
jgi:hypothetical protein